MRKPDNLEGESFYFVPRSRCLSLVITAVSIKFQRWKITRGRNTFQPQYCQEACTNRVQNVRTWVSSQLVVFDCPFLASHRGGRKSPHPVSDVAEADVISN